MGTATLPTTNAITRFSNGANSMYGSGGLQAYISAGNSGAGYGAGGSGAAQAFTAANLAGGVGTPGIVIITEFIGA
jgi:hypothetical protein